MDDDIDLTLQSDAETVRVIEAAKGPPVDPAGPGFRTTWAEIASRSQDRPALVPAWLRNKNQRSETFRALLRLVAYYAGVHAKKSPVYTAKLAWYAPVGVGRAVGKVVKWASAEDGNWTLRQEAANKNDAHTWMSLNRTRAKEAKARWTLLAIAVVVLTIGVPVLLVLVPIPKAAWQAAAVVAVLLAARLGRPPDKPFFARVTQGKRFTKLTAEMVRAALLATGYGKEPGDFTFPDEIHKEGTGYLALVELPDGVTATMILDRWERVAARLRLPMDQVWGARGRHPGELEMWVARSPVSQTRQAPWPLLKSGRADIFAPLPLGTNERGAPINALLMFTNLVIGAIPRMGKTFVLRLALLAAALDPRVDVGAADLKGTGDLGPLQRVCRWYIVGDDDDDLDALLDALRGLRTEMRRRTKVIRNLPREVCPETKVTPELAVDRSLGLRPVVFGIDECQVAFLDKERGAEFEELCTDLIKRGPAVGIILLLATQRPDANSLPTGISGNAGMRLCLRVMGQQENDMVLGTSMYKNGIRATRFSVADKGMGWLVGAYDNPIVVRTYYVDAPTAEQIVNRAVQLRGGVVNPDVQKERVQARDMLADVRAVWRDGETGVPWDVLAERLAELAPDTYAGITGDMVREALKRYDVPSENVNVKRPDGGWTKLRGVRRTALDKAVERRALED